MPERAATLAELRAVREQLHDLTVTLERQVDAKIAAKVAEVDPVPREEFQRRIRRSGMRVAITVALVLALAGIGIGLNRATLQQAQQDVNRQVAACFLRPSANTPAQTQACAARFGAGYAELQQRNRASAADSASLRAWAKERGWKPPSER